MIFCDVREDWEFLVRNDALDETRMRAVETGGCPHAAIREDYSMNMEEVRQLTREFLPQIVIIESGGDNLAANFSRELADYIIYVIDVAGQSGRNHVKTSKLIYNSLKHVIS